MRVPRFVQPGETLRGSAFHFFPGGKGANQACAAAKLGSDVLLAARLGTDPYSKAIYEHLDACGVQMKAVETDPNAPTGTAIIQVDDSGQNAICITAGANDGVNPMYLRRVLPLIDACDILLLQLEIPIETVHYAIKDHARRGKFILLDPAPAAALHNELLRHVDIITPNETELEQLTGISIEDENARRAACEQLSERGVRMVLHKAGAKGSYLYAEGTLRHFPAYDVTPVDTTAAGDTFNGALANALARGLPIEQAIDFANLAGAISTLQLGAQGAMPTMEQAVAYERTLAVRHETEN